MTASCNATGRAFFLVHGHGLNHGHLTDDSFDANNKKWMIFEMLGTFFLMSLHFVIDGIGNIIDTLEHFNLILIVKHQEFPFDLNRRKWLL